ncbi:MAG: zinc ribbon domain-containing protein [Ruminococcus sp.]|nr:zinc ribbon domain-containing protein [Ruminococcus sp.]
MSKFCTFCGTEADDNALFCGACGTKFEEPVVKPQEPYNIAEPEQQPAQPEQPIEQTYGDNFQNVQPQPAPVQPQNNQFYYGQSAQFTAQPEEKQKTPGKGIGIASMILGIVAVFNCIFLLMFDFSAITVNSTEQVGEYAGIANFGLSFVIIGFGVFIIILALLSLTFAIVSMVKGYKGICIAGLILSILAVAVCVFSFIFAASLEKPTLKEIVSKNYSSYGSDYERYFDDIEDQFGDMFPND